jgi:hypothetical protein
LEFEILRKNVRELEQKKKRGNGKNTIECHNYHKLGQKKKELLVEKWRSRKKRTNPKSNKSKCKTKGKKGGKEGENETFWRSEKKER